MKIYFKPLFLLISFLFFSSEVLSNSTLFIIYRDFGHKGDENQAHGIVRAFTKQVKEVKVEEFNIDQEANLQEFVQAHYQKFQIKPILLAVGEKTVGPLSKMAPLKEATTIHVCHMVISKHKDLLGKINFMALPKHALEFSDLDFTKTSEGLTTKLIPTIGVAHNRQSESVEDVYQHEKARLPQKNSYLGIILAGDAPTPEGTFQLFKKSNAQELARYVASNLNGRHLLIINGPRTGKHKLASSQEHEESKTIYQKEEIEELKTAHRDGKIDFVTQAFLDELQKKGISENQMTLFDFQFGPTPNQDMDLVLGALKITFSPILAPGESTSAISEAIDVLPQGMVTVYHNSAMNAVHKAHVKSELNSGRIHYLTEGFQSAPQQASHQESEGLPQKMSAAETIAKVLADEVSKETVSTS